MKVKVDARQIRALGVDLAAAGGEVGRRVEAVVFKGAKNVKDRMRRDLEGSGWFKGISPAVSFDMKTTPSGISAEIGPESRAGSAGNLANIAYFGTSRGGGTVNIENGLREEEPRFQRSLEEVLADVLRSR